MVLAPVLALSLVALSPRLPSELPAEGAAESFAWEEFVALSWPARSDRRGEPDTNKPFRAEGLRVWETWKSPEEIFLPGAKEPPGWESPLPRERDLTENLQAVQSDGTLPATLTDRYGHVVRYEVRVNKVLFDYLQKNRLYDSGAQQSLERLDYPAGSVAIKASWRELEPGEESQFLTRECIVFDTKNGKPGKKRRRKMGLVGLHIVQKTPNQPQWVWTTFEHTGNTDGHDASFQPIGVPEARLNLQSKPGQPNLIRRVGTLPVAVQRANRERQQALHAAGSVLQNYELVGVQHTTTSGQVSQPFLSNTTMESFVPESSCQGCHATAGTLRGDRFAFADYLFLPRRARPEQAKKPLIDEPRRPVTEWERQNWRAIQRGHALTARTYELLPKYVGDRLHCGSCHLDNGRNPSSSWWVGMFAPGKYDTDQKFYDRINQCMQRSMNGSPLPTDGPEMAAFRAYFIWLDQQAEAQKLPAYPTGMPKVQALPGDRERGKALFTQRCAACHGTNGEGRYGSRVYYRPALWGPNSFNNLAGLGAKPEKMAGFLKHNMPFGSGGSLSLQEAWDLTAFLVAQPRPIKSAP